MCSQQFTDLASLSALAKYTTGGVYCYPGYDPARDALKLQTEITHNLTRQTGMRCGPSLAQICQHLVSASNKR